MSDVIKIALTGGPGAGKSTGLSVVSQKLTAKGYKVLIVAETATENIIGGINPSELDVLDFQDSIFKIQRSKENVYQKIAELYASKGKNVVILFDRGCIDNKAYMSDEHFKIIMKMNKTSETKVRDFYHAVFHLKTAADGAEEYYTLENNAARSESPELARELDRKIINAWTGHSHLRIIDNSTDFQNKIDRLLQEIYSLLGIPVPIEIERKYLIEMPNIVELQEKYSCTKVNIIQTYLKVDEPGIEERIRQRGIDGEYTYYYTKKQKITGLSRVQTEKVINQEEYLRLMMDANTTMKQIRKDRYCFVYNNSYFELDVYPFWDDKAILEIELTSESEEVNLPDFLKIIKEVSYDESYKNGSLAKNHNLSI